MKKSKNFKLVGQFNTKLADEIIAKYESGSVISCAEMQKLCGTKIGNEDTKYVLFDGAVYYLKFNTVGDLEELWLYAETLERKEKEIKMHEDREITSVSDAGGYLINGLLFPNGYGDGVNTIVVRKFLVDPQNTPTSKVEIYNKEKCATVYCPTGVKVWGNDCDNPMTDKPAIDEPNAFKICVCGSKLYVFVKGW